MNFPGNVGFTSLNSSLNFFDLFKVFEALVENPYGRKPKILISDNGGEYVKSKFIKSFEYTRIQMKHSIPYTPQCNGVTKRKNRALKEMATCMMEFKILPPNFWAEYINFAFYIQNRVPHKEIYGITHFEAWSGHKSDVSHFNIFGSRTWARIPLDKRRDLELQSQECLFFGYLKYSKGYNLINMITQISFIEISVQFEEEPMPAT